MNHAFLKAIPVLVEIEKNGFEAYFVGGAVRDYLLNKPVDDVDIATSATPEEVKQIFLKTVDVGIEHGTVLVLYRGESYEVTTFRAESEYKDRRRPAGVTFIRSLKEDLQRRDFTMNAIAMDKSGTIIDPFCGQKSIEESRIETVGNAGERFSEDALRIMRAVRFASQLSFSIESSTFKALSTYGHLLTEIAIERKTIEFEKLLTGKNWRSAVQLLVKSDIYKYLPGLAGQEKALGQFTGYDCSGLLIEERWSLLLYVMELLPENIDDFLREWKLPVKKIREIQNILYWLLYRLNNDWTRPAMFQAKREMIVHAEKLANLLTGDDIGASIEKWLHLYDRLPIKDRSELRITGKDLLDWSGTDGGPWVKEWLAKIETAVLKEELENDKEKIREWLARCNLS